MSHKKQYQKSYDELQQIVQEMQEGEIGIDDLAEKIKRATELIKYCKARLSETEENVARILQAPNENT